MFGIKTSDYECEVLHTRTSTHARTHTRLWKYREGNQGIYLSKLGISTRQTHSFKSLSQKSSTIPSTCQKKSPIFLLSTGVSCSVCLARISGENPKQAAIK